jgi:prephenate dehydrogenase
VTVIVIGLGLVGGSIGRGLIESGFAARVIGVDKDRAACRIALQRGCAHEVATSLDGIPEGSLWVLAVPPLSVPDLLASIARLAGRNAVVTDTCSVKHQVELGVPESLCSRFIGGHPMAGHQASGIMYARADLFRNAYWVLCPNGATCAKQLRRVESMVYALDAKPVCMTAEQHDRSVALLSHLPHALAYALSALGDKAGCTGIAGGSWRDLTRIAASDPGLWEQIMRSNRQTLADVVAALCGCLESLEQALRNDDIEAIREFVRMGHLAKQRQVLAEEGRLEP